MSGLKWASRHECGDVSGDLGYRGMDIPKYDSGLCRGST